MGKLADNLKGIISELSPGGGARALLVTGTSKDTGQAIDQMSISLPAANPTCLWVEIDGRYNDSPKTLMANFARNIKGGNAFKMKDLGEFGRETGKMLARNFPPQTPKDSRVDGDSNSVSRVEMLMQNFEKLASTVQEKSERPIPTFCFSNLSSFTSEMQDWICLDLNNALRKSNLCKAARFVFTDRDKSNKWAKFFNRFGFEKVKRLKITPKRMQSSQPQVGLAQTKELKKIMNSSIKESNMRADIHKNDGTVRGLDLNSFSEKHRNYILLACLPQFINRDTLEYFCSSSEAAYCYNWLLRTQNVVQQSYSNFLVLNPQLKQAARNLLREQDANAEKKEVLASVLDKFMEFFPQPEEHWIPINLQLFASFSRDLLAKVLDEDRFELVDAFLSEHPEAFSVNHNLYSLKEDPKLITRRLLELTEHEPLEGLSEKIAAQWQEDQVIFENQKTKLESEKVAMEQEIDEIKGQITHFSKMRDQLIEDSNNPNAYRPKKNFTFSLSLPLILLGLTTIGASLFSESIGSYHAACGLFLTFIGFFWPNVELQKPEFQTAGGKPKLAIETQQRSFNHRISGLVNRASSLKESLGDVAGNLDSLETGSRTPYLSGE
jgi:hypothetical protein